jgi:hypothetical protein
MMIAKKLSLASVLVLILAAGMRLAGDQRQTIYSLGVDLEREAERLARASFDRFRGRDDTITDEEQAVLFKSEAFLAACRLFLRLTEERSDYFGSGYLRTNLYNAFLNVGRSFRELEESMRAGRGGSRGASDCRRLLAAMDAEFSRWPSPDNLAYLHERYVKAERDAVYLIEQERPGRFVRHAFRDLESLYRYNYDRKRGKDPWAYLVQVAPATLAKMPEGEMIDLTFDGRLVIEQGNRPNRGVYRIENGKKRVLSSPQVLQRLGGWSRVFEVPAEVIDKYPEGEPIN